MSKRQTQETQAKLPVRLDVNIASPYGEATMEMQRALSEKGNVWYSALLKVPVPSGVDIDLNDFSATINGDALKMSDAGVHLSNPTIDRRTNKPRANTGGNPTCSQSLTIDLSGESYLLSLQITHNVKKGELVLSGKAFVSGGGLREKGSLVGSLFG